MNRPLVRLGESSLQLVLLLVFRRWELVIAMACGSVRGLEGELAYAYTKTTSLVELMRSLDMCCRVDLEIMTVERPSGKSSSFIT